ncbi:Pre-mRNA-splicing factor [Lobulomyces angularis]|nr:Pre-mRNA-splicing factor [Lobulomyces angularis]
MSSNVLDRPARKQVKETRNKQLVSEDGGEYNIWYNKFSGERKQYETVEKALHRCNVERDSGRTKSIPGGNFCLHFARGSCNKGPECYYHHRIPTAADRFDLTYDCFGRPKHREEREDKSGTGSFEKDNRSLYVGPCHISSKSTQIVHRHFSEWGEIDSVRFLASKGVAFVRYKLRASAEFAKEAMLGQSLDHTEILNVRWAVDDTNEDVQADYKRRYEEIVAKAVSAKLPVIGDQGTYLDYEDYYSADHQGDPHSQKRVKVNENEGPIDIEIYKKYYEDCAKYYRDLGDHQTAIQYAQYASQYAEYYNQVEDDKRIENGEKKGLSLVNNYGSDSEENEVETFSEENPEKLTEEVK